MKPVEYHGVVSIKVDDLGGLRLRRSGGLLRRRVHDIYHPPTDRWLSVRLDRRTGIASVEFSQAVEDR
jgi:hypothetical protein